MKYRYWFANIPGIGNKKKLEIIEYIHEAEVLYRLNESKMRKLPCLSEQDRQRIKRSQKEWRLEEKYYELCEKKIDFITWEQAAYPKKLRFIYNPPYALYLKGKPFAPSRRTAAIVGARLCSEYGKAVAEQLGKALAEYHIDVISGMAEGIDRAGHIGALKGNGNTFAVLGNGIEVCYPSKNWGLYQKIQEHGSLISEQPIDMPPKAYFFPLRNRIISGLSDFIIVVEAKKKSGALITADYALEQGKEIYAVPGRICDELSYGTNWLIKQGAGVLFSFKEMLLELNIDVECLSGMEERHSSDKRVTMEERHSSDKSAPMEERHFIEESNQTNNSFVKIPLEKCEKLVYSCVDLSPKNLDQLFYEAKIEFSELARIISVLKNKGYIKEVYKNYYIKQDLSIFN